MRKSFIWICAVALCTALLSALPFSAEAASSGTCGDNITWVYEGTTLTISGQGEMVIDSHAPWYDCYKICTTVVVGEGITTIGHGAFSGFRELTSVTIPDTVTSIGSYAFSGCTKLAAVPLTEHITYIDQLAFQGCHSFTEVTIPASLKEISHAAFSGCSKLNKLTISSGVQVVGSDSFSGCPALTEVRIPDSVTTIGGAAFSGCSKLKTVQIGKNVTDLGGNVFSGCTALESIVIPDSVKKIGSWAFNECKNLTSVTIGAGVQEVDVMAFEKCSALKSFTLSDTNPYLHVDKGILYTEDKTKLILAPKGFSGSYTVLSGTKTIGERAFYECEKLTAVTLADSVTEIGRYGFDWCKGLTSVDLGAGLQTLKGAFGYCTRLTSIRFPATFKTLGQMALNGCTSLREIYFLGDLPSIGELAFEGVTATAYYPGSNATWKNIDYYGGNITWKAIDCKGNHTPVTIKGTPATCTQNGKSDGSYCSVCGQTLTSQRVLEASHSYGSWTTKVAATTQAAGREVRTCAVCGATEEKMLEKLSGTTGTVTTPVQPEGIVPSQTPEDPTVPSVNTTEPENPDATTPDTAESATPKGEKNSKPKTVVWIIMGVAALVIVADVVVGVIYLKKRKGGENR